MGSNCVPVYVVADDPILRVGVSSQLHSRVEVQLLDDDQRQRAEVVLVVADRLTDRTLHTVRSVSRGGKVRPVLVVGEVDGSHLIAAVQLGIVGLVRRAEATAERLVTVVVAAAHGEGSVPPDLLGRLLGQVARVQQPTAAGRPGFNQLAEREVQVLKLVADGFDTVQIAARLSYSPRTVKNVLHDVTSRLHLNNRSHAVAYALRQGLI